MPPAVLFVSSISYYADFREPRSEDDPAEELGDLPDDRLLDDYSNYGALKAALRAAVRECSASVRWSFGRG